MDRIDRRVDALLVESGDLVGESRLPNYGQRGEEATAAMPRRSSPWADEQPETVNPAADTLSFVDAGDEDTEIVLGRLDAYNAVPDDALQMDLAGALVYAAKNSRQFKFAEEQYVLAALRLLIERHQWGPRFFNDMSALITGDADGGVYDTSLELVNELTVTQRLPYGGTVSATALARAVEDLHLRVEGENVQSADIILAADVPLLRGAGLVARESRIQAERDLVYAARDYARFRREFLFDTAREFLDLIVIIRRIRNAELGVDSLEKVEARQDALYRAGRSTPFDRDEARNRTLSAVDGLNGEEERYRLAVDRFKVIIGMPIEQPIVIVEDSLDLPTPKITMEEAVYAAMHYRIDLQTERDQVDDARRAVEIARNNLLGDLDFRASVNIPTADDRDRAGLRFEPDDLNFEAGITYGLPLDREIERLQVRQTQIDLARTLRAYDQFRDEVAVAVRAAVRGIDTAMFSLRLQEANVETAVQREAAIEAAPERANIRQKTDAIDAVFEARDRRDAAIRNLEVAILRFLLDSGQLRVDSSGLIDPLPGMELGP
jgi:outer membrane protein TolC